MSLLTSDGLIADRATTSNDCIMKDTDEETNVNNQKAEITNLHADDPDLGSTDSEESTRAEQLKVKQEYHRKRKRDNPSKLEKDLVHSQNALKSLKKHLERQTCPKSLQYRARANIKADSEFRKDIKRLRSKAEQEYVQALIRFHNRNIEGLRTAIRQEKRVQANKKQKSIVTKTTAFARSAPKETVNENTVTRVSKKIEDLKAEIMSLSTFLEDNNKQKRDYTCLLSDSLNIKRGHGKIKPSQTQNEKRKERRRNDRKDRLIAQTEANKKHIKNLSDIALTNDQTNLLAKGLKFIPTPKENETQIRSHFLKDFENFAKRMRLQYIFFGEDNEPHPFHVKSNWIPPVQKSVALESYLEEVKVQLAEIQLTKPKDNLLNTERKALKTLRENPNINLKKADKGTRTVVLNTVDKIREGQIQLDNPVHYQPLERPMVVETSLRVQQLVKELYEHNYIDDVTNKWFCQTPNPPRTPVFYTLTKIHKPTPVGRPIISGCDGPTERLSAFVDKLLQPIAQEQESYLKDSTDFINFIERTRVPYNAILVSMDVTSLYTNIPQEEGIETVCHAYDSFYEGESPIPTQYLKRALELILQENSFQFTGKNYLQTHGTAMGTKMAVSFANIFMGKVESQILERSAKKPLAWKRYIDDIFSIWNINKDEVTQFIEQANSHHQTIKFTAEVSGTETTFLDTKVYKGERFAKESRLDIKTHFKATETFQYTHFSSCHPPGVKKGFIKGEALRLLRTNSSKTAFKNAIKRFKTNLIERGYPETLVSNTLAEITFEERKHALQQKQKPNTRILPFVTQYRSSVPNLKHILMQNWHLIQQQPLLRRIFKDPPIVSYRRGRSLKDILVRAKL